MVWCGVVCCVVLRCVSLLCTSNCIAVQCFALYCLVTDSERDQPVPFVRNCVCSSSRRLLTGSWAVCWLMGWCVCHDVWWWWWHSRRCEGVVVLSRRLVRIFRRPRTTDTDHGPRTTDHGPLAAGGWRVTRRLPVLEEQGCGCARASVERHEQIVSSAPSCFFLRLACAALVFWAAFFGGAVKFCRLPWSEFAVCRC